MKIMQHTGMYVRKTLHVSTSGITARAWRTKAGGGWYPEYMVYVPWPWRRRDS